MANWQRGIFVRCATVEGVGALLGPGIVEVGSLAFFVYVLQKYAFFVVRQFILFNASPIKIQSFAERISGSICRLSCVDVRRFRKINSVSFRGF